MEFTKRTCEILHDEHYATIALLNRLEQMIAHHRRGNPPNAADHEVRQLLSDLSSAIKIEVQRHFSFEENCIFTYLDTIGDGGICAHLTDEHRVILPIGMQIAKLAGAAATQGFDEAGWNEFLPSAQEFCERLQSHIQKEEMALLPMLEENMNAETDARLFQEYAEKV